MPRVSCVARIDAIWREGARLAGVPTFSSDRSASACCSSFACAVDETQADTSCTLAPSPASANAKSSAVSNRAFGSRAMARITASSTFCGMPGTSVLGRGTGALSTLAMSDPSFSARKRRRPTSVSQRTTPAA